MYDWLWVFPWTWIMLLSNNPDQSKVLLLWIKNCRRARGHGSTESTTQRKVSGSSRAFRYFLINVPLLKDESKLLASQLPWFQIWTLTLCRVIIRSLDPSLYIISTVPFWFWVALGQCMQKARIPRGLGFSFGYFCGERPPGGQIGWGHALMALFVMAPE